MLLDMASRTKLHKIHTAENAKDPGLDIVYIHGFTTPDAPLESGRWPNALVELGPNNSNLFEHDLSLRLSEQMQLQDLAQNSFDLLESIYEYREACKGTLRPVLFCCYGIGGSVLKQEYRNTSTRRVIEWVQTLWEANERRHQFHGFIEVISGIIFLATPHITESDDIALQRFALISRTDLNSNTKRIQAQANLSFFSKIALQFEQLSLDVPIMSCYETQETKLRASLWRTKKLILVDATVVSTSSPSEILASIDTDLTKVFDDTDSTLCVQIRKFLHEVFDRASKKITEATNPQSGTIQYSALQSVSSEGDNSHIISSPANGKLTPQSSTPRNLPRSDANSRQSIPGSPLSDQTTKTMSSLENSDLNSAESNLSYEFIRKLSDFSLAPRSQVKLPNYQTRPFSVQNPDFHGRQDALLLIERALNTEASRDTGIEYRRLKTFSIIGPGGIGKTQLAAKYVLTRKHQYDAIFWLQADKPEKLATGFSQIAIHLGLETTETPEDPVANREVVKAWLADPSKRDPFDEKPARWLLVFDNADDPEILHDFLPRDGQGCILITSRDPLVRTNIYFGDSGINLGALESTDAAALLRKLTQYENNMSSEQLSRQIVNRLDCFPLAIVQMAGIIQRRRLSLADFLELYNEEVEQQDLHSQKYGPQQGYEYTLATVWSLQTLTRGAFQILSVVSFLDPDSIQEQIFTLKEQTADLPHLPYTKGAYKKTLQELVQSSLIHQNRDLNELSIHRLIQDVVKGELRKTKKMSCKVFKGVVALLSSAWPFVLLPQDGGYPTYARIDRWVQCEKTLPHILRFPEALQAMDENDRRTCSSFKCVLLLTEAAWYQYERSRSHECNQLLDAALKAYHDSQDDLREVLADIHNTRGTLALDTNDPDVALFQLTELVALREKFYTERGILTGKLAMAYSELGKALLMNGQYARADELFLRSIEIRRQLKNFSRLQFFNPLRGRALVHWQAGRYEAAASLYIEALQDREEAFGTDDKEGPRTGSLLYGLGDVRYSQHRYDESLNYYLRAVVQFRSTAGDNTPFTAMACYKVALLYFQSKKYTDALALLQQALKVYKRASFHAPELARTNFVTSRVLAEMSDPIGAGRALVEAHQIRQGLVQNDSRSPTQLQQADFDNLIVFWTR